MNERGSGDGENEDGCGSSGLVQRRAAVVSISFSLVF